MASELPYIGFGTDDADQKIGTIGADSYKSVAEMLSAYPALAQMPLPLAQALNHFSADGDDFIVITDPETYEAEYLKRYAADQGIAWDQFHTRLSDYTLPDFTRLTLPEIENGQLTFCANFLGMELPYIASGPVDGSAEPQYEPL